MGAVSRLGFERCFGKSARRRGGATGGWGDSFHVESLALLRNRSSTQRGCGRGWGYNFCVGILARFQKGNSTEKMCERGCGDNFFVEVLQMIAKEARRRENVRQGAVATTSTLRT